MGELRSFYRRGSIAFVGGSLVPGRGGQNPAEPALADVPVLIGPYHENQQQIVSSLVSWRRRANRHKLARHNQRDFAMARRR